MTAAARTRQLRLEPASRAEGVVSLPGSKSISNRSLLLAALAKGTTTLVDVLAADDTDRMLDALKSLGVDIEMNPVARTCVVKGAWGAFPMRAGKLFLGNAGTAFRPLTAVLAILGGNYELSGVARMHERPIGDLVDALRALGCDVRYLGTRRFPRLRSARRGRAPARASIFAATSPASSSRHCCSRCRWREAAPPRQRPSTSDPLISRPVRGDHDQPDAPLRRCRGRTGCADVRRAGGCALFEPGVAGRRGRRVVRVVFPGRGCGRRRTGARHRCRARFHPGRHRVCRDPVPVGRHGQMGRTGSRRAAANTCAAEPSTASPFPTRQ